MEKNKKLKIISTPISIDGNWDDNFNIIDLTCNKELPARTVRRIYLNIEFPNISKTLITTLLYLWEYSKYDPKIYKDGNIIVENNDLLKYILDTNPDYTISNLSVNLTGLKKIGVIKKLNKKLWGLDSRIPKGNIDYDTPFNINIISIKKQNNEQEK